jgi:hypothetical protein
MPGLFDLHARRDLLKRIKLIPPVQPLSQKYFGFLSTQITSISSAIPSRSEGRFAIVTDAGWDAVDAEAPMTNGA